MQSSGRKNGELGAGELLLTSMDRDGTKSGFDLELTRAISDAVDIPIIASGGVGICSTWSMASAKAMPMRCWQRAFSTLAIRRGRSQALYETACIECGCERLAGCGEMGCTGLVPAIAQDAITGNPDGGVDEPRGAGRNRAYLARRLLVALAQPFVAQGENRACTECQRIRLDCDNDVVLLKIEQLADCLSHWTPLVFLPETGERPVGDDDPVLKNPDEIYRK